MTDNTNNTVADWLRKEADRRQRMAELRPINKAALFDALAKAGITRLTVSFDGSCDSGQIEVIEAYAGDNAIDLPAGEIEFARPAEDGGGLRHAMHTVQAAIETLTYDILEEEHDGWEINDGAFGEFTFDVKEQTVTLAFNQRFTDSEYSESVY